MTYTELYNLPVYLRRFYLDEWVKESNKRKQKLNKRN